MKKCNRCSGQMILDSDMHGKFLNCCQCGHNINITIQIAPHASSISGEHADAILNLPSKRFMSDTTL